VGAGEIGQPFTGSREDLGGGSLDGGASGGQDGEGNILQSAEVQQRVESKKVGQETVQKGQVKEGVKKVVEFVLGELNMQQPFFMPHRIARSI
jgi:hypothetical protein